MNNPPPLTQDPQGRIAPSSLADLIAWFLEHDPRVAAVRQPAVEQLFQWKQEESRRAGEAVFEFESAEARLAVGVMQALIEHASEPQLHDWIGQLLNALDDAAKTNEEIAQAYQLETRSDEASVVAEAAKIPTEQGRALYLTCCWLETLCTAEIRILGWVYQELYGRPFSPR
ncbi:MAG: hypothetical protein M3Q76_12675 [Acidobacteriota bacterium]|nr:hypothetical protein [Acidobacteriota bacterium]